MLQQLSKDVLTNFHQQLAQLFVNPLKTAYKAFKALPNLGSNQDYASTVFWVRVRRVANYTTGE